MKVTFENQLLLKRLQGKESHYNIDEWEVDFRKREKILKKMCEYPYILQQRQGSASEQNSIMMGGNRSNNTSTIMEQIQQIVGQFPTNSKGKAMLDINSSAGDVRPGASASGSNVTNYGAWNKLTKNSAVVR